MIMFPVPKQPRCDSTKQMDARVQAVQTVIRFKNFVTNHRFLKSSPETATESPGEVLTSVKR